MKRNTPTRTSHKDKYKKAAKNSRALVSPKNQIISGAKHAGKGSQSMQSSPLSLSLLATAISLSLMAPGAPLYAATIDVSGACTLIDAIVSANTDTASGNCPAGTAGQDVLILSANSTHSFDTANNTTRGDNGLPVITSSIFIKGNGATITRTGSNAFRHFLVDTAGSLNLNDITLSNGNINNDNSGGGAIHNRGSLQLTNSRITGNVSLYDGGGVSSYNASTRLSNSTVSGNAANSIYFGGGLYLRGGSADIDRSTVSGNTAGSGGGIRNTGNTTLSNSTVSSNHAPNAGGGVENFGTLNLINSTIANNTAGASAGGVSNNSTGTITLDNSLIANNMASNPDPDCRNALGGTVIGTSNSLIKDGDCGNTVLTGDPLLGPLQYNGGPTQTHALLAGSAAIDKGLNADCAAFPISNKDQTGSSRPVGILCDIGAFEFVPPPGTINVGGGCDLVNAITAANTNQASGACPAGGGVDTIILPVNSLHSLSAVNNTGYSGNNGLPMIASSIIIQGNGSTITRADMAPTFRHFYIADSADLTLESVTITGGSAPGNFPVGIGGAVFNHKGTLTLVDSELSNNQSGILGGAVYAKSSISSFAKTTLTNSTVSGNMVGNINIPGSGYGGGLYTQGLLEVDRSTISNNTSAGKGGGIFIVNNSNFSNSTISGNIAYTDGGGLYIRSCSFCTNVIDRSTVSGNTASTGSGGISTRGNTTLSNSTVSGNTSIVSAGDNNGAAVRNTGTLHLINSTIVDNTVTGANNIGGVFNPSGTTKLYNSLIANNDGLDCTNNSGILTATDNSFIGDNSCGTTALSGDPLLGPLADNGGPTQTHEPLFGSPLIDKADNALCAAEPINNLDQRGEARPEGVQCDIGAVEYIDRGGFFVIPIPGGKSVIFSL